MPEQRPLRIWLVQTGEPLPRTAGDQRMRTGRLADVLAERGHRLLWWTSAFDHFEKRWLRRDSGPIDLDRGVEGYALRGLGYRRNVSVSRWLDHRRVARAWAAAARTQPRPDVIVASMPPHDLAAEAVGFARRERIPVILDVRDPWPDLIAQAVPHALRGLAHAALGWERRIQARAATRANAVVSVSRALLDWEYGSSGRRPAELDRVIYTGAPAVPRGSGRPDYLVGIQSPFVVAFVGTFSFYHAPWPILAAARTLPPEVVFVLAGDGQDRARMQGLARDLPNVLFPGWLSPDRIASLLQCAHVGICPASEAIEVFPNKAFSYLSAGVPIVSQFEGDLRLLMEEVEIGSYVQPGDDAAFVQALVRLFRDPEARARMAGNARRVFSERFDSRRTAVDFAEHVERVARSRSGPEGGTC